MLGLEKYPFSNQVPFEKGKYIVHTPGWTGFLFTGAGSSVAVFHFFFKERVPVLVPHLVPKNGFTF